MDSITVFLSATGLIWCALFALLMIGIMFIIKRKKAIKNIVDNEENIQ